MNALKISTLLIFLINTAYSYSESETWKNFQAILNSITTSVKFEAKYGAFDQTAVDYEKLKNSSSLQSLMTSQIQTLTEVQVPINDKEAMVFWINAYNFFTLVDMSDLEAIRQAIQDNTRLIWIETPSNPLLRISDIKQAASIAHSIHGQINGQRGQMLAAFGHSLRVESSQAAQLHIEDCLGLLKVFYSDGQM